MSINLDYEFALIMSKVKERANAQVLDINRRIDLGIYGTPKDITIAQLWEQLDVLQNGELSTMSDWGRMFVIIDEIQKRGGPEL